MNLANAFTTLLAINGIETPRLKCSALYKSITPDVAN